MHRNAGVILMLTCTALAGCYTPFSPGSVNVRVRNAGAVDLDRVLVGFPRQLADYGPLVAGASAPYREVDTAYRYAYFEVHVAGDTLRLTPIDYVGETPLAAGRYTYDLAVEPGPQLLFRLVRD